MDTINAKNVQNKDNNKIQVLAGVMLWKATVTPIYIAPVTPILPMSSEGLVMLERCMHGL